MHGVLMLSRVRENAGIGPFTVSRSKIYKTGSLLRGIWVSGSWSRRGRRNSRRRCDATAYAKRTSVTSKRMPHREPPRGEQSPLTQKRELARTPDGDGRRSDPLCTPQGMGMRGGGNTKRIAPVSFSSWFATLSIFPGSLYVFCAVLSFRTFSLPLPPFSLIFLHCCSLPIIFVFCSRFDVIELLLSCSGKGIGSSQHHHQATPTL